jgi:hypothetical protein
MIYEIKTYNPKSHMGVCEIILLMGISIIRDSIGEHDDEYYGFFRLESDTEGFEIFSELPDIITEIIHNNIE